MSLGNFRQWHANRLTVRIVEGQHFSVFAKTKPRENLAGVGFNCHHSEGDVHIAARVERVFEQTVETTVADAVESRAERLTYFADLMAIRADAFRKNGAACFRIVRSSQKTGAPLRDQLLDATIFRRKARSQLSALLVDAGHARRY